MKVIGLVLLTVGVSCSRPDERVVPMMDPQPASTAVRIILHPERDRYSIGEPVSPKLQIKNDDERAIEIGAGFVFNWEQLAFAAPNQLRLIDPEGNDLALVYRRRGDEPLVAPGVRLPPGGEEWMYLPIHAHIDLRKSGDYRFSVALAGARGTVHESNEIRFHLADVAPAGPGPARITLTPRRQVFATGEPVEVEVRFHNDSDREMIFLEPQQDSFYGWVNPVYRFRVTDSRGRGLPLALRSGTMAIPSYPPETRFALAPGGTDARTWSLPEFPAMSRPGSYRVTLVYIVRDHAIGKGGVVLDQEMSWPQGVFRGRLESNEVTVEIR